MIKYSKKSKAVEKAVEMAQFGKVVDRLEKGLDTNVMEKGVSLSHAIKELGVKIDL